MAVPNAKKGNANTELVVGKAAASLTKAVSEFKSATASIDSLIARSEELSLDITSKEQRISDLDVQYTEKQRQAELDFSLKMKENATQVVNQTLASQGMMAVNTDEYNKLKAELAQWEAEFEKKVNAEVGKATGIARSGFENEKKLLEAQYNAREADNKAEITNLKNQNLFLTTQVEMWKTQLDDERKAGIERAKAGAVGTIQVGSQDSGRR